MTTDNTDLTAVIENALQYYGQGIHHGRPLAQHIADALRDENMLPTPEPETLQEWSDDLAGTWVEDPHGKVLLLLDGYQNTIEVWDGENKVAQLYRPTDLTPRPDLAPVDLTPRPVEGDA